MVSKLDNLIHKKVNVTFLQRLDVTAGEGDPDAVDRHLGLRRGLAGFFESLKSRRKKRHDQRAKNLPNGYKTVTIRISYCCLLHPQPFEKSSVKTAHGQASSLNIGQVSG